MIPPRPTRLYRPRGAHFAALLALLPCAVGAAVVPDLRPPPPEQLIAAATRRHTQVVKLRSRALVAQREAAGKLSVEVLGSEASGVLVGQGLVLTTLRAVALPGAQGRFQAVEDIEVFVAGRGVFPAALAGGAPDLDIAVLEVNGLRNLPGAPLAETDPVAGDSLIALGAVGEDVEAVEATVREPRGSGDAAIQIETAAALTRSFAGGPLVDEEGRIAALLTPSSGEAGTAVSASLLGHLLERTLRDRSAGGPPKGPGPVPNP